MDIDRGSIVPIYQQIADALRLGISTGKYPPGRALPSETELADQLGVARLTVRKAVRVLAEEGLVAVVKGRGAFVTSLVA
jgi:DNA-binding GntR family transcriptional regulator